METAIRNSDIQALKVAQVALKPDYSPQDVEIRTDTDYEIRKTALKIAQIENACEEEIREYLEFVIECAKGDLCTRAVPVNLLQDIFDVISIEKCQTLFQLVEERIPTWKSTHFFEHCKNHVLRLCNDLLKRLSRTVDTGFCGRILVFLARCLPLTEKSGLNLVSQFNVDNCTTYERQKNNQEDDVEAEREEAADEAVGDTEEGEMKDSHIPVDYTLYCKFWQLQDCFSAPSSCYDRLKWKKFQHNINEVFSALASYKLEDNLRRKISLSSEEPVEKAARPDLATAELLQNREKRLQSRESIDSGIRDAYFAKYLTSQKLLQLQLNDSDFRRYFLVQCIILFQYFQTDVKFKDKKLHILADDQSKWVDDTVQKCYKLLKETHPNGQKFADSIKHIMNREKHWSDWKNSGCPDFTTGVDKEKMQIFKKRQRATYNPSKIDLGTSELTRLWNIEPNTMAACRGKRRNFIPKLETFLADSVDQLDDDIDENNKLVHDELFQWRACRLLSVQSPHFYVPLPKRPPQDADFALHLDCIISNTAQSLPDLRTRLEAKVRQKLERQKSVQQKPQSPSVETDETWQEVAETVDFPQPLVTETQMKRLAVIIANGWVSLAKQLDFSDETIASYKKKSKPASVAELVLFQWAESEGDSATVRKLRNLMLKAELFNERVAAVFSNVVDSTP